jgi:micrococcal nuclease
VRRTPFPGLVALLSITALVAVTLVVGARLLQDADLRPRATEPPAADVDRPATIPADAEAAIVARVVDGDTIRVRAGAGDERVRLLNVDAPELDDPADGRECGARTATRLVEELLPPGATVWLAADREDRDRFDRLLRYAWTADGVDVQATLVEAGLAEVLVVPPNDRFAAPLRPLEATARETAVGVWGPDCPP